jgi:hypothetical protein
MAFWLAEIAGKQSAPYRGGEGRSLKVTWKRSSAKSTRPLQPDAELFIRQDLQDEQDT